jgi:serine/threonine-protein kinase
MVHRDVKPGNLLVRRSDGAVKITDFGIARAADAVPLTQNGMVVGTAQYFSPEQAEGRVVGPPSDVYSLGVVAYECLAGRLPFVAESPVAVAMMQIRDAPPPLPPDVPAPVRALVLRALAKDPWQRFPAGGELAEAVRAVQEGRYELPAPVPAPVPIPVPDGVGGTNPGLAYPPPWAPAAASWAPRGGPSAAQAPPPPGAVQPVPPPAPGYPDPPGFPGTPPPVRPAADAGRRRRASRWPLWIAATLLLVLAVAGVVTVLLDRGTDGDGRPTRSTGQFSSTTDTLRVR